MKKRNVILTFLSICGVITTFAFVAVNTIRTNNARQSVVSNVGYEYPKIAEKIETKEDNVVKGVSVSVPIPPETEEIQEPTVLSEDSDEYIFPVTGGKIINEFTDSVLVFNETYDDYRTHLGIDIEAPKNSPVFSVRDGIIIKSEKDLQEGYVVHIEHPDGIVSVYKNLTTNEMAPVGKVVSKGETIGGVGTSAVFESHLNPHLHFEILEDNVEMNPTDYIK